MSELAASQKTLNRKGLSSVPKDHRHRENFNLILRPRVQCKSLIEAKLSPVAFSAGSVCQPLERLQCGTAQDLESGQTGSGLASAVN